ncbi:MAG: hypothetical protein ACRDQH_15115 [Pseudonocardiaceae bacterium]
MLPAQPGEPGGLGWDTKYPWWRVAPGRLSTTARHLEGPTATFAAHVPTGYGTTGFQSSTALGCWQVSATNAGKSLTFTVWIQRLPPS